MTGKLTNIIVDCGVYGLNKLYRDIRQEGGYFTCNRTDAPYNFLAAPLELTTRTDIRSIDSWLHELHVTDSTEY